MSQSDLAPLDPGKGVWDEHELSRRKFLEVSFWSVTSLVTVGVIGAGSRFVVGNSLEPSTSSWVSLGPVTELTPGSVHRVNYSFKAKDAWRMVEQKGALYAFSDDNGATYTVLDGTCTHLGCIVQWQDGDNTYTCPCHQAVFTRAGTVVSGPAPRPLRKLEAKIQDGALMAQI
jgi:menaquinol-cytochrome c reductase iron-sulfur subunit